MTAHTNAARSGGGFFQRASATLRKIWLVILLFAIARLIAGLVIIGFGGGFAWGIELTIIAAVAAVVYVGVGLAVQRWSPPHRTREP